MKKRLCLLLLIILLTGCVKENQVEDDYVSNNNIFNATSLSKSISTYYNDCIRKSNGNTNNICENYARTMYEPQEKSTWIINGKVYNIYDNGDNYQLTIFYTDDSGFNENICLIAYEWQENFETQKNLLLSYKKDDDINLKCQYRDVSVTNIGSKINQTYKYDFYNCENVD